MNIHFKANILFLPEGWVS